MSIYYIVDSDYKHISSFEAETAFEAVNELWERHGKAGGYGLLKECIDSRTGEAYTIEVETREALWAHEG